MSTIKGLAIQDIHFGMKESERLYKELQQVIDYLVENKDIQIVHINGDYFDKKLSLTDPAAFYAVTFFSQLVKICIDQNIKLRVINGTASHELNQLQMFEHYLDVDGLDMKIIYSVMEENLLGLNVLYIPEEYPENMKEYYAPYMAEGKTYHMIHGHGTWDFTAKTKELIEQSERTDTRTAPVFMTDDWLPHIPNGFVIFGHIHNRQKRKNKIFYSGSFSRWNFVDPSDKGFAVYEIDPEKGTYDVQFIDNKLAPNYETIKIANFLKEDDSISYDMVYNTIEQNRTGVDLLRVNLTGLAPDTIKLIKKAYEKDSSIVFQDDTAKQKALLKESAKKEIIDKYDYILKRQLPIAETIQRFAREEFDENIDLDVIKKNIE